MLVKRINLTLDLGNKRYALNDLLGDYTSLKFKKEFLEILQRLLGLLNSRI
jgi:hypothetical protein